MIKIKKKQGKRINAYRLGERNEAVNRLISEGKIIPLDDGRYEVMSQEAVNGRSGHGELADEGAYIKVDGSGYPYPIAPEWFEANHRRICGDEYEQIPQPLDAWTIREPMCKEIEFLIREKGLEINDGDWERYFTAPLWGTVESAAGDSVVVFYSICYAEDGTVTDAEFNFIVRDEFERTYEYSSSFCQ